jgi:hypothetical protein
VAKAMFPWALRKDETNQGGIHQFVAAGISGNSPTRRIGTTIPQAFDSSGCANTDIQADLESQLHEKLLKKVFHEDQRVD